MGVIDSTLGISRMQGCTASNGLASAVLLVVGMACGSSPSSPAWPCSEQDDKQELFDPYRHDVCLGQCFDAFDCPRGSICAKENETSENGFCTLPGITFQTSQRALLDGFGVGEMTAELVDVEGYELHWTRPTGAKLVNCALLTCAPAFRTPGHKQGEWQRSSDPDDAIIANYHHCAIASEQSTRPEGAFNLRERDNQHKLLPGFKAEYADTGSDPTCPPHAHGCAPVTELLAGCWAYDDSKIVAATRLFSIDSREIYSYYNVFAPGGRCRPDGRDLFRVCVLDEADPMAMASSGDASAGTASSDAASSDATSLDTTASDATSSDATSSDATSSDATSSDTTPPDTSAGGATSSAGSASDEPGDGNTSIHGLCACSEPPCTVDVSSGPQVCLRPCLSSCDCQGVPEVNGCREPTVTRGVCVGGTCTAILDD